MKDRVHAMQRFEALARRVADQWRGVDALPEVAARALEQAALHDDLDPLALVDWITRPDAELGRQLDMGASFGQPPLTVHWDRDNRFVIDVYFHQKSAVWLHDHSFIGAFTICQGASLHVHYRWDLDERLADGVGLGVLSTQTREFLSAGAVREIQLGEAFIHGHWHLSFPTVTCVVRTPDPLPQRPESYSYYHDGLAIPMGRSARETRRRQFRKLLIELDDRARLDALDEAMLAASPRRAFQFIYERYRGDPRAELLDELAERAAAHHGNWARRIPSALRELSATRLIGFERARTEDHRLFIAGLMSRFDVATWRALMAERAPGRDIAELIPRWVAEMSEAGAFAFELPPAFYPVLGALIRSNDDTEIAANLPADHGLDDRSPERLQAIAAKLRGYPIFRSLLTPSA